MGSVARASHFMTIAEWAALDDDISGELVDGKLEDEEATSTVHDLVLSWLLVRLATWAEARGGYVFCSDHKLALSSRRGRKPDLTVYGADAELDARARASHTTPLSVVEIVTPTPRDGRRDRVDKRRDYAKAKIRFYWIVDPTMRTVEVFELGRDGRYATAAAAASGKLRVRGLAGLVIDLDALFRAVDRLEHPRGRKR